MLNKLLTLLRAHDKLGCVRAVHRSWRGGSLRVPLGTALEATLAWLCAAQDATPDGGVSYGYSLTTGWRSSYPETTGYIIPSFLACAEVTGNDSLRTRALRMADWEIDVQLPDGAVQSGPLGTAVAPAVFDTGQVLFGWNAAYRATRDPRYRAAAIRAGEWLVGNLDADGAWRKNLSNLTEVSPLCINVRSAWALAESGCCLAGRISSTPAAAAASGRFRCRMIRGGLPRTPSTMARSRSSTTSCMSSRGCSAWERCL